MHETPADPPLRAARTARPARHYDEVVAWYRDLVGLPVIGEFGGGEFDGTIFGLPDERFQLELLRHRSGEPAPQPTEEDLLVLYLADETGRAAIEERLEAAGEEPVPLANGYWAGIGAVGYRDPDGWILVIA
ncbi:MAG: VOC family protein [Acidimicrobiia bacterium]|nr:VOC family protein [Acidimicrobiia bacterium]